MLAQILGERIDRAKLKMKSSLGERVGTLRAMTIGLLIDQCAESFLDNEMAILEGEFDTALTDRIKASNALNEISVLSIDKIYRSRVVTEIEAAGFEVLPGLLHEFAAAAWSRNFNANHSQKHKAILRLLPADTMADIISAGDNTYYILRAVLDFVSGLTDKHALNMYRQIKGTSLPKMGFI